MVSLFKGNSISSIIFLILLCGAVHIHLFLHSTFPPITEDNGLISFALRYCSTNILYAKLAPYVYLLLILAQSIRLNVLLNNLKMYNTNGFTTALSYVLLSAIIPQWTTLSVAIIANSFVIWIFISLSNLYNSPQPKSTLFNTGLLVGSAFLCYHPTIVLIAVVLFALAVVRPFVLSEWFVLLLGILMPVYLFVSFLFLGDKMNILYGILPRLRLHLPINHTDIGLWVKIVAILIMLLIGLQHWSNQNSRMVIQIRKNWSVMLVMLLFMLPIPFIFKNSGLDAAILWIVPLSAFIGNTYLYPKKALIPNLIFFVSLALIIHTNWLLTK